MTTLLRLFEDLASDPATKARFAAAPDRFLAESGFGDLPPEDLAEALSQAADSFPPALAAEVDADVGLESLASADLGELGLQSVEDFDAVWEPSSAPTSDDESPEPKLFSELEDTGVLEETGALEEPTPAGADADDTVRPSQDKHPTEDFQTEEPDFDVDPLTEPVESTDDPFTQDVDDSVWVDAASDVEELDPFGPLDDFEGDVGDEML